MGYICGSSIVLGQSKVFQYFFLYYFRLVKLHVDRQKGMQGFPLLAHSVSEVAGMFLDLPTQTLMCEKHGDDNYFCLCQFIKRPSFI